MPPFEPEPCGQTIRNHLRYQDQSRLLAANDRVIEEMISLGALSKPLILAIDWHDEMYYRDPNAEGVVDTQPKDGFASCIQVRYFSRQREEADLCSSDARQARSTWAR